MRKIDDIRKEIEQSEEKLAKLTSKADNERYCDETSKNGSIGLKLFFRMLIFLGLQYLFISPLINGTFSIWGKLTVGLMGIIMLTMIVKAFKLFKMRLPYTSAKLNLIFWGLILAADVMSVILFLKFRLPDVKIEFGPEIVNIIDRANFPVYFVNETVNDVVLKMWMGSVLFTTIVTLIAFIAFLVCYLSALSARLKRSKAVGAIEKDAAKTRKEIEDEKAALAKNVEEAQTLYRQEILKDTQDSKVLKQAAEGGSSDAALMVALDIVADLMLEKGTKNLPLAEDALKYIDLAEDTDQRDLWNILDVWTDMYMQKDVAAAFGKSKDSAKELEEMTNAVTELTKSDVEIVRVLADDVLPDLESACRKIQKGRQEG